MQIDHGTAREQQCASNDQHLGPCALFPAHTTTPTNSVPRSSIALRLSFFSFVLQSLALSLARARARGQPSAFAASSARGPRQRDLRPTSYARAAEALYQATRQRCPCCQRTASAQAARKPAAREHRWMLNTCSKVSPLEYAHAGSAGTSMLPWIVMMVLLLAVTQDGLLPLFGVSLPARGREAARRAA